MISGLGVNVWRESDFSISEVMTVQAGLRISYCGVGERTDGALYGVRALLQGVGDVEGVDGELEETELPLSDDDQPCASGGRPTSSPGRASGLSLGAGGVDTPAIFLRKSMARWRWGAIPADGEEARAEMGMGGGGDGYSVRIAAGRRREGELGCGVRGRYSAGERRSMDGDEEDTH